MGALIIGNTTITLNDSYRKSATPEDSARAILEELMAKEESA